MAETTSRDEADDVSAPGASDPVTDIGGEWTKSELMMERVWAEPSGL